MAGNLTSTGQFRHDFWKHYSLRYPAAPIPADHARAYLLLPISTRTGRVRLGLSLRHDVVWAYVIGAEGELAAAAQLKLGSHETALQAALGRVTNRKRDPLHFWCATELPVDTNNRSNWNRMTDWLERQRQVYERVLLI